MRTALLLSCLLVGCTKPPPMVGSFEGEVKYKAWIEHDKVVQHSVEERAQNVRATIRVTNDDEKAPAFTMVLEGAPLAAPCTMKATGEPREAIFTSDGCKVKTQNFEGSVDLNGLVKLDPADELVAQLHGENKSNGNDVYFHFNLRGKRKPSK